MEYSIKNFLNKLEIIYKRLIERFKPNDILDLNNKVAVNKNAITNNSFIFSRCLFIGCE